MEKRMNHRKLTLHDRMHSKVSESYSRVRYILDEMPDLLTAVQYTVLDLCVRLDDALYSHSMEFYCLHLTKLQKKWVTDQLAGLYGKILFLTHFGLAVVQDTVLSLV